jgi:hypothetical protein
LTKETTMTTSTIALAELAEKGADSGLCLEDAVNDRYEERQGLAGTRSGGHDVALAGLPLG